MFHWKKMIAVLCACVLVTACAGAFAEDYTSSAPGMGGDVPVNELEGLLGEDIFENADCDTIGGFITETLGRIPQAGETLPLETLGYTLTVAEATPRAVTKVTITRTAEKTADPQPAPEQKRRFGRKKDRDGEK